MTELDGKEFKNFLYNLTPEVFENFVARVWSERGWNANVTQISGDSGIDIVATKESPFQQKQLIQAKRYGSDTSVGSPDIQQYASLRQQGDNVDSVVVVTSSGFSNQAVQLAEKLNVKLVSGDELYALVAENGLWDVVDEFDDRSEVEAVSKGSDVDSLNTSMESSDGLGNPFSSAVTVEEVWRSKPDGSVVPPTLAGDTIYMGGGDGFLHALEIGAGVERWKVNLEANFRSAPTIGESAVYIGDVGNAYALNRKEQTALWKLSTEGQVVSIIEHQDTVYLKSSYNPGSVHALNAKTGEEYWSIEIDGTGESNGGLTIHDDVLFFGAKNGMHAVDSESGEYLWQLKTDMVNTTPAVVDGMVYFGSWDNHLYALDATNGTEIWSFETGDVINSSPTVVEDTVYFGSNDFKVYALNAVNGVDSWSFKTGDAITTAPAVSNGHVYAGCMDGTLYAVSAEEGDEVWSFDAADDILLSPTIRDGHIYAGVFNGDVFALRESR